MNSPTEPIANCDVAIIGGGIVGCWLAYFLARAGVDVVLLEKHGLCSQASGSNAGSIHEQMFLAYCTMYGRDGAERYARIIPYNLAAGGTWEDLGLELGADFGVKRVGGLMVVEEDVDQALIQYKVELENRSGGETRYLAKNELHTLAPYLAERVIGAVYTPNEGKIDILKALPVIWAAIKDLGVKILTGRAATAVEFGARANLVHSQHGAIRCRRIVNAAGGWSPEVSRMMGWPLFLNVRPIQSVVTERVPPIIEHLVAHTTRRLTLKQNSAGSLVMGGGWPAETRGSEYPPSILCESLQGCVATALRVVPAIAGVQVLRSWASYIYSARDGLPVVGEVPGAENCFVIATNTYGITLGPLLARLLSESMLGQAPSMAMDLFSPERPGLTD